LGFVAFTPTTPRETTSMRYLGARQQVLAGFGGVEVRRWCLIFIFVRGG
jgi:hypothetical protein